MGDERIIARIEGWQAAGLIDAATAERLRADEATRESAPADAAVAAPDATPARTPSTLAQIFGPGVSIGEMFAYLGGGFLLGAYNAFVIRTAGSATATELTIAIGTGLAAAVLTAIAVVLSRSADLRRRRAAGAVFAVAAGHVAAAGTALGGWANVEWPLVAVIGAVAASAAAVAYRYLHAALLTQATLLAALTGLAAVTLSWLESIVAPDLGFTPTSNPITTGRPEPVLLAVAAAAWWLVVATGLGLLGLREARIAQTGRTGADAAGRRAGLTRLWAGLLATAGLASAILRSDYLGDGGYGRVLEPWVGDLALVALAAILVERAFRRGASTFVYAAALALMIGLSDFNFSYLSDSTEAGLLVEGLILLAAGFAADRLRRRLGAVHAGAGSSATIESPA